MIEMELVVYGFVVMPTHHPEGSDLFFEEVVPILPRRGLFRTEYSGTTLRSHFGLEVPARVSRPSNATYTQRLHPDA